MNSSIPLLDADLGIYIHLPFCQRRCPFCDYLAFRLASPTRASDYLKAIGDEARLVVLEGQPVVSTVYLGGGTPTLLPPRELVGLLDNLRDVFTFTGDCEISVEANPETLSESLIAELAAAGVNRFSLGVQSFEPRLLDAVQRKGGYQLVARCIDWLRNCGIENYNFDLIYGLPGMTLADWENTLTLAISLHPTHLATYCLHLDPISTWGQARLQGRIPPADEEIELEMLMLVRERLQHEGYQHYELANFALPGWQCRHNLRYWQRQPYLGLGTGSSSCSRQLRWSNHRSLQTYLQAVAQHQLPVAQTTSLSEQEVVGEALFLGLRLLEGVDVQQLEQRYGLKVQAAFGQQMYELQQQGLITVNDCRIALTNRGLPLANLVFAAFV